MRDHPAVASDPVEPMTIFFGVGAGGSGKSNYIGTHRENVPDAFFEKAAAYRVPEWEQ
jgi:hypothetical protein